MNSTLTASPARMTTQRIAWSTALIGGAVAAGAALLLWLVLVPLAGIDLAVSLSGTVKRVGALDVVVTGFVAGLGALVALRVLQRCTARVLTGWTVAAVLVLLVSYAGPLTALSTSAMLGLIGLHTVVGATVITIGRRSRSGRRSGGGPAKRGGRSVSA